VTGAPLLAFQHRPIFSALRSLRGSEQFQEAYSVQTFLRRLVRPIPKRPPSPSVKRRGDAKRKSA
jgi:hypothetical protein